MTIKYSLYSIELFVSESFYLVVRIAQVARARARDQRRVAGVAHRVASARGLHAIALVAVGPALPAVPAARRSAARRRSRTPRRRSPCRSGTCNFPDILGNPVDTGTVV